MKKILISALALLCACTSSDNDKTLRLCLDDNPPSLDPRRAGRMRPQLVTKALYEGLVRLAPDNTPALALAESVDISDDKLTYTFHLKESVWNDGSPVTAHDFEYAWKSLLDPSFGSRFTQYLYPIKNAHEAQKGEVLLDAIGVRAQDDRTLVVTLAHPAPYFLELLANPLYSPVSKENPSRTNGPFALVEWKQDAHLKLAKNPNYWDAGAVEIEHVEMAIVRDGMTSYELFKRGKSDWAGDPFCRLPPEALQELAATGALDTVAVNGEFHFTFDTEKPPYNSKKVRQALAFALNREEIIKVLPSVKATSTSLLPSTLSLQERPLFADGNLEIAKRLFEEGLQEIGLTVESCPPIVLGYRMEHQHKQIAQIVQQQWQEAFGVKVQLKGYDAGSYFATVTNFEIPVAGFFWYSIFNDPSYNLEVFSDRTNKMNSTHWEDPLYRELLVDAENEVDDTRRRELYKRAEALIIEEMPAVPVFSTTYAYATPKRIHGVYIANTGYNTDLKWARLD